MTVSVGILREHLTECNCSASYWRSATYDIYTGAWLEYEHDPDQLLSRQSTHPDSASRRIDLAQEDVSPVENLGGSVYAAGEPVTINLPSQASWRSRVICSA